MIHGRVSGGSFGTRPRRAAGLVVFLLLGVVACGDERAARVAPDADDYIRAVQHRDATGLIKRMASFRAELLETPRERWEEVRGRYVALAGSRLASYDEAKVTGWFAPQGDGIVLIQGLAIGKGIFYRFQEVRLEEGGARAVGTLEVLPDYSPYRLRGLPAGTRVYLMGEPLGTLQMVKLGDGAEDRNLRVIARVLLEWRFAWFAAEDVYPAGWAVESIRPVPDSVEMTDLPEGF